MATQLIKEAFVGKYDGVSSPLLLPPGSICDGENVRKISAAGGWKARKGCSHHNTTAIAAASVLSLHRFVHPRNADYHFLAQCNSTIVDATNDPPTGGTTFGSSISAAATISASQPGFSDVVGESWLYADGGLPVWYGGDTPFVIGFLCYDNSESIYVDYTRDVIDNRTATEAIALGAASDVWYICCPQIAEGLNFTLGSTVNTDAATLTLYSWQSGAWSDRSETDGTLDTATSTKTMNKTGSITWTRSASDTMSVIGGIMGYWYKIAFSGALSNSVDVVSITCTCDLMPISNKWDGVYEYPLAVNFYDQSDTEYVDLTGKLTNESTAQFFNIDAATTNDFIYVKSKEPLTGIGFGIVDEYESNAGGGNVDLIEYWSGDAWTTVGTLTDETYTGAESFGQTGVIWWNGTAYTAKKKTMPFDSIPGYWYRVSWDAAPDNADDTVYIYMVTVVPYPEALGEYDGVIEFKGRPFLWGDPEFPNRLRYGAYGKPDCFSGNDSGYTDAFGDMTPIVCVKRFYNELLVFKENSVWLMEGYSPETFGVLRIADTIGCCAYQTPIVIETGFPSMHADEPLSIAIWMDVDGVYVLDGRKPRKVSMPVNHYFDTEFSTAIGATYLDNVQAFSDRLKNEYHLIIPGTGTGHGAELVYNYVLDEWYPPWDRTVGGANDYLVCGLELRGSDNRYYTYGGANNGRVLLLEDDTTDKDASDADVAIDHSIKTRAISFVPKQSVSLDFTFRKLWVEAKARTSPSTKTITANFFKDLASSGTAITTPAAISLANTGYSLAVDGLTTNQVHCRCFQWQFVVGTADLELEIYSFLYTINVEGELDL